MKKTTMLMLFMFIVSGVMMAQVTFQVNMSKKTFDGDFDPAADSLFVRGDFNGWSTDHYIAAPGGSDSIWTVTVDTGIVMNTPFFYKFMFRDVSEAADVWEDDPNREGTVGSFPSTIDPVYFNDEAWETTYDMNVYFAVNMELERLSGRFDPANDTVSVNGSFNGWGSLVDILTPSPLNSDVYEGTFIINAPVGGEIQYKFWYTPNVWESIADNRLYTFTQNDVDNGDVFIPEVNFNNGSLSSVINQACQVTFTVNCIGALDGNGTAFSSIDNAIMAGSSAPLAWPEGGWPTSDSSIVIFMFDDGTNGDQTADDDIFTKMIEFPAYTTLGVEYKYGINFGLANNNGANDNEGGVGANHTLPWEIDWASFTVVDTFGVIKEADVENIVVGVEELPELAATFEMSQNYPNPFNPTTMIKFSIPENSFVTLKVYNVLGQEVTTLVNEEMTSGAYEVDFNAIDMTSGIYFYTISAGDFTATKKMMLLK